MNFSEYRSVLRPRRLRTSSAIRGLVRETKLSPEKWIQPLFIVEGKKIRRAIRSMPGQYQFSIDQVLHEVESLQKLKIAGVILFGIPNKKDALGSQAFHDEGIIQKAIKAIKGRFPNFLVMADCCLCEYTNHGHCGVLNVNNKVDNDPTLEILSRVALAQAAAGADIIAPSGMMDGVVQSIRRALDQNDFTERLILSYAVKYASSFYGPFRDAAQGAPQFGDRSEYQMDFANAREALREAQCDELEGADILMVKPALAYLDIIREVSKKSHLPLAAYNVSGEYAMVKAAAKNGWVDEKKTVFEILTAIHRAGAQMILTYHAKEAAEWIRHTKV